MLTATTAMTLSHDSAFVGRDDDPARAVEVLERLWLNALWGGADVIDGDLAAPVGSAAMAQGRISRANGAS